MKCLIMAASILVCTLGASVAVQAAFPADEIQILERADITALTEDKLIENYIDVLVEMEAVKTFHMTSGFMPKEYRRYKELLKYRLLLIFEIDRRKLELPAIVR